MKLNKGTSIPRLEFHIKERRLSLEGSFLLQTPFSFTQIVLKEPNKIITLSRRLISKLRNNSSSRRVSQV